MLPFLRGDVGLGIAGCLWRSAGAVKCSAVFRERACRAGGAVSGYNSTEFGVPTTGSPPKSSWLGADGIASGGWLAL